MKRVLFVDDEPQVLDGLRDLLRKQRKQWDMVFASGGQQALAELEKSPFDVIVSDMRMPGIDGATLLAQVKERYPATARIILSGHAERESVVRALPVAHQFLSKPCDAALLKVIVERACGLQNLLQDERIRSLIGKLDKLPSVPHTYWELTQAAARPDVALADLALIVEQDPAMTIKILQLVNSAYFGLPQQLSSVRQAVSYLGVDLLKALALTVHAFGTMQVRPFVGFSLEALQQHSLLHARLVKKILPDPKRGGDAFTAAMVHEIGKALLAMGAGDAFAEVLRAERATGRPHHVLEKEMIGVTHTEVGAYLLGSWGLPLNIVEAVAFHHTPSMLGEGPTDLIAAVHIGDALLESQSAAKGAKASDPLDHAFVERIGAQKQVEEWRSLATQLMATTPKG